MLVQFNSELNITNRKSLWKTFINKIFNKDLSLSSGTTDHTELDNLPWTTSRHTATANRLMATGAGGEAVEIELGTNLSFDEGILNASGGGSVDEILDIPTAETNTALVLAPDGEGGVEFRAESGGVTGKTISKGVTFTEDLDIDKDEIWCEQYEQIGVLNIALIFSNGIASSVNVPIFTNGDNINFPGNWCMIQNEYVNDNAIYKIYAEYDGTNIYYSIIKIKLVITLELLAASIESANKNRVLLSFSKAIVITTDGWSITTDGGALSISSVTGSGSSEPYFVLSRNIAEGENIAISYDSNTGDTHAVDLDILSSMTDFNVDNNVVASWEYMAFTITALIGVTESGHSYAANPYDGTYNHIGLADYKISSGQNGSIRFAYIDGYSVGNIIGFNTTESNETFANWEYGIFPATGVIKAVVNGSIVSSDNSVAYAPNDFLVLSRENTDTIKIYRDRAGVMTLVHTFAATYSGDLFIQINPSNTSPRVLIDPMRLGGVSR